MNREGEKVKGGNGEKGKSSFVFPFSLFPF
jgi:hypothetical protein